MRSISIRRRLVALAAIAVATVGALLAGAAPAQAVWYPWQDPGASRAMTEAAVSQVGRSYCWGGGNEWGPTYGIAGSNCGASTGPGFDCSGLVHYSLSRAGRNPGDQTANGYAANLGWIVSSPRPGDLLFWDWDRNGVYDHVAIYLGLNRDNNVNEFVEASGYQGATAATGHRVKISRYNGAHRIKRVF